MESCVKRTLKTVPQRLTAAMIAAAAVLTGLAALPAARAAEPADLWRLAIDRQTIHRFSTLITASQVRDLLATDAGIDAAIEWCKETGVTKVYIETFRSKYMAYFIMRWLGGIGGEKCGGGWFDPYGTTEAPCRVALYLFSDGSWVIENFNDRPVTAKLDGQTLNVGPRGWICQWK